MDGARCFLFDNIGSFISVASGRLSEWSMEAVLKTVGCKPRGFESLTFRIKRRDA